MGTTASGGAATQDARYRGHLHRSIALDDWLRQRMGLSVQLARCVLRTIGHFDASQSTETPKPPESEKVIAGVSPALAPPLNQ